MNFTRRQRALGRAALLFSNILPHNPDLKILSPRPAAMIRTYDALRRSGMARTALISPALPPLKPAENVDRSYGSLERCEIGANHLRLKGWVSRTGRQPAPFVLFAYRSTSQRAIPFAVAATGDSSPGLIRHGRRNCGFQLELEPNLPPGKTEISAWAIDPERKTVEELAGSRLIVIAPP